MDCLFCGIAAHEIPAFVVHEDDATIAFLDVNPRAAGHTVVIPKRHSETLLETSDDDFAAVFRSVRVVVARLVAAQKLDAFTIGVNHGRAAGQAVPHLHVHVIPRQPGDGGGSIHTVVDAKPSEGLAETHRRIVESRG